MVDDNIAALKKAKSKVSASEQALEHLDKALLGYGLIDLHIDEMVRTDAPILRVGRFNQRGSSDVIMKKLKAAVDSGALVPRSHGSAIILLTNKRYPDKQTLVKGSEPLKVTKYSAVARGKSITLVNGQNRALLRQKLHGKNLSTMKKLEKQAKTAEEIATTNEKIAAYREAASVYQYWGAAFYDEGDKTEHYCSKHKLIEFRSYSQLSLQDIPSSVSLSERRDNNT